MTGTHDYESRDIDGAAQHAVDNYDGPDDWQPDPQDLADLHEPWVAPLPRRRRT